MHVICSKCENVVLPKIGDQIKKDKEEVFCSRCDCKYENRNTTIIKVLIALLADFISLLCGLYNEKIYVADRGDNSYMGYLFVSNLYVILNLSRSIA